MTVGKGEFAFMGHYVIDQITSSVSEGDPLQQHYANVIAPGSVTSPAGRFYGALAGDFYYRGAIYEAKRDDATRREFFSRAKEDLAEGGWAGLLR